MENTKQTLLYQSLEALCNAVIEELGKYRAEKRFKVIPYQQLPVSKIDYDSGVFYYDWENIRYFDYFDWEMNDYSAFSENVVKLLPAYKQATLNCIDFFGEPIDCAILLYPLINKLMKTLPNRDFSPEQLERVLHFFINDCISQKNKTNVKWKVEAWLQNISLENDLVELSEGVFLRRINTKDLMINSPVEHYDSLDLITGRHLDVGAVLTLTVIGERHPPFGAYPAKLIEELDTWLNILRLFKVADVVPVHRKIIAHTFDAFAYEKSLELPYDKSWIGKVAHRDTSTVKLVIKEKDEIELKTFAIKIKALLSEIKSETYLSGDSYDIAVHRYTDALIKSEVNAYKILSAITALEALLSDGSNEILYKIRWRTAKLLSFFSFNGVEVAEHIKSAYSLRSKLVHGGKLTVGGKKDMLNWANQHTQTIINYTRICLLAALQLKHKWDKNKLLEILDNAFVDTNTNDTLAAYIQKDIYVPQIGEKST
jgi:Apea-like HEPN